MAFRTLAAIHFHDKPPFPAREVSEIGTNRELPDEFITVQPPIPDFAP